MTRRLIILMTAFLLSGCGFLDDEMLMSDESFEHSFELEGLGLSGVGTSGCGCGGFGRAHFHRRHRYYMDLFRIWVDRPLRLEYRDPSTGSVSWETAGTRLPDTEEELDETSRVEAVEHQVRMGAEMYLDAGYEVRIVALQDDAMTPETESVSVLVY